MVHDQNHGGADGCDEQAFEIESSYAAFPKAVEEPTADHRPSDPQQNVQNDALAAPIDLQPKTAEVILKIPAGTSLDGATVILDPDSRLGEITRMNNSVRL